MHCSSGTQGNLLLIKSIMKMPFAFWGKICLEGKQTLIVVFMCLEGTIEMVRSFQGQQQAAILLQNMLNWVEGTFKMV